MLRGDVLLASGPVPHDGEFPDFSAQLSAIGEHILTLPGQTRVLPGHGEEITVSAAEKRFDSWVAAGPSPLPARDPDSRARRSSSAWTGCRGGCTRVPPPG